MGNLSSTAVSVSQLLQYPVLDVDDVDRDGVANDLDVFPAFETEWLDSDGDLIGDNSDPDADPDGDGVPNSADAFPQSARFVDTDGDGAPDEWNANASSRTLQTGSHRCLPG